MENIFIFLANKGGYPPIGAEWGLFLYMFTKQHFIDLNLKNLDNKNKYLQRYKFLKMSCFVFFKVLYQIIRLFCVLIYPSMPSAHASPSIILLQNEEYI